MKRSMIVVVMMIAVALLSGCIGERVTVVAPHAKAVATPTEVRKAPTKRPTATPAPTPQATATTAPTTTEPETATMQGTVMDVMLSARVILLKDDKGIVAPMALAEHASIFGPDGREISLRDVPYGAKVKGIGRRTAKGDFIASEVHVYPGKQGASDWRLLVTKADGSMWSIPTDGGTPTMLLPPPADKASSGYLWALSPDRKVLAFDRFVDWRKDDAHGSLELLYLGTKQRKVVLDHLLPKGVSWKELPDDADRAALIENKPVWNHAGTAFAFLSAHEGKANLYLYDMKSGKFRLLAAPPHNAAWPRWSPDDQWVLYNDIEAFGTGAGPTGGALWAVKADGRSKPRRLSPDDKHFEPVFAWLNDREILTAHVSLMGVSHPSVLNIVTGKRIAPVKAGDLKGYVISVSASGKPTTKFLVVNGGSGSSLWQLPKPVKVENAIDFPGEYLSYIGLDGTCYVYQRGSERPAERPERWCAGVRSPDGKYTVMNGRDHLNITSTGSGSTFRIETGLPKITSIRWIPSNR